MDIFLGKESNIFVNLTAGAGSRYQHLVARINRMKNVYPGTLVFTIIIAHDY